MDLVLIRHPAVAIDAGVSKHTGAVFFQVIDRDEPRCRINVFGDYYAQDLFSLQNAESIRATIIDLTTGPQTPQGRYDTVRLDPAQPPTTPSLQVR